MTDTTYRNAIASGARQRFVVLLLTLMGVVVGDSFAGVSDLRLRTVLYSADEVYRLPARVGYEIELEFQQGEIFLGLGSGDTEGLSFKAEGNHLFIKPKALNVHTNVTVLTDRRVYRFDYVTLAPDSTVDQIDTLYALRFLYPKSGAMRPEYKTPGADSSALVEQLLQKPTANAARNFDYWYCGAPQLKPVSTWDDGVQTHFQFGAHAELPALFVKNEDGTESLINFNIVDDELVVHRIARRFLLRRGKLLGCVLNKSFIGSGERLSTKTLSPRVERRLRDASNEAGP